MINVHIYDSLTQVKYVRKFNSYSRAAAFLANYGCFGLFDYSVNTIRDRVLSTYSRRFTAPYGSDFVCVSYSKC